MTARFEMVKVQDLILGGPDITQRHEGVDEKRARRYAAEWDMDKVGTITVSRRPDGRTITIDGAHRATAAKILGVEFLPAIVHSGLSRTQEASMFGGLNDFARPSAVSRFLARVDEHEPRACDIKRIVDAHGWRVESFQRDGNLTAIAAVERVYRDAGATKSRGAHPDVLDWSLDVATSAWGHDKDAANGAILLGLAQLFGRFGSDVDTKKLVSEMSQSRPKIIIGHARALRDAMGGTLNAHVAKVLVGLHNKKRRTNLLPEWVWTR